jgi:hypothetical protein
MEVVKAALPSQGVRIKRMELFKELASSKLLQTKRASQFIHLRARY